MEFPRFYGLIRNIQACQILIFFEAKYRRSVLATTPITMNVIRGMRAQRSADQVASMLQRANGMLSDGMSQKDICARLGISVMTFHRWRKRDCEAQNPAIDVQQGQLLLENIRLRRIVSDIALEITKLREDLNDLAHPTVASASNSLAVSDAKL